MAPLYCYLIMLFLGMGEEDNIFLFPSTISFISDKSVETWFLIPFRQRVYGSDSQRELILTLGCPNSVFFFTPSLLLPDTIGKSF